MNSRSISRRSFFKRLAPVIALPLTGIKARADDLSRGLGRIWVSRPPWLGGLGLRALPAIPVDIQGMVESIFRLVNRLLQTVPAKLGLSNEYTINGRTATAFEWMYGEPLNRGQRAMRQERALSLQLTDRLSS